MVPWGIDSNHTIFGKLPNNYKENARLAYTPRDDESASNHRKRKKNQRKRKVTSGARIGTKMR